MGADSQRAEELLKVANHLRIITSGEIFIIRDKANLKN